MRAFKQFLSLVLVTCMLTSMVTLVSADYAFTSDQKWDSDSGRITMVQDTGKPVDSNYTRVQDSGVDATLKDVGIDLSNKKDVTVTITGEKIADSGYTLMVYNSDSETPLYTSDVENRESNPDVKDGSDKWKITFEVSPAIIAAGTRLDVYRGEDTEPGWKIQYTVKTTEITGDQPVEIPPVFDEETKTSTIQAETVNAVLNALAKDATSATVTVQKDPNASLLLDINIFDNEKFTDENFSLKLNVTDDSSTYTWIFTNAAASNAISLMSTGEDTIDLGVTVKDNAQVGVNDTPGTTVVLKSAQIPDGKTAKLEVSTDLTGSVNVYYKGADEKWHETEENKNCPVEEGKVTFQVVSGMTDYAIVDSDITLEAMNGTTPEPGAVTYEVELVEPSTGTAIDLTKEDPSKTVQIKVVSSDGQEVLDSNYKVTWTSDSDAVKVLDSNASATSVEATGTNVTGARVTATVTLAGDLVNETLTQDTVTVTVNVSGFETEPEPEVVTYKVELVEPSTGTAIDLTKEDPSKTVQIKVVSSDGQEVLDSNYKVTWKSDSDAIKIVNSNASAISVEATGTNVTGAQVTATVTLTGDLANETLTQDTVTVTVNVSGYEDEVPSQTKVEITVTPSKLVLIEGQERTLKATVKVDGVEKPVVLVTWESSNTNVVTVSEDGLMEKTIKAVGTGNATVTATFVSIDSVQHKAVATIEVNPKTSGDGSTSSGGGNSGTAMPNTGSGAITTPGTGTTTPGAGSTSGNAQPQGCVSDTVGNFSIAGAYQYKLTSTNGTAPVVTVSNSNFRVVLASQNGNDYFYKVYAIGAPGQTCDVYVNGTKVSTVTASSVYGGVMSDTTAPFTVKKGGSYQFKLTASSQPTMVAGSSSFRVEYVGNSGNDWFFKVYATGNAGDGCGFYVNGAPFTVAVAHIAE